MATFRIYGLIGFPVKHSLSPLMHNAAFGCLGIKAEYRLFPLKENELKYFLMNLSKNNIFGLNVTIPYKEKVLEYLDWKSEEVKTVGAVNTILVERNNYLKGYNTDGIGFYHHLRYGLKFNPKGKNVLILGAGGASKAISNQLAKKGIKTILIYDIDKEKSKNLAKDINLKFKSCKAEDVDFLKNVQFKDIDLLINATPVGMKKEDPCLVKKEMLHKGILVYDLIYNPAQTKLLNLAKEVGARFSNGLGMLLYQGMFSFEIWTKKRAPKEIMEEALRKANLG
ncbi:MAG: shikimate dehydrogenase [Candidatus Omnitrophica bacterium]|nr:shikimate dehydrogenase [Candidatus Omnitrophota bacterium]MCM8799643.1 shikimate dehydrogenase [Candidatus Omnitrophota bacterium]